MILEFSEEQLLFTQTVKRFLERSYDFESRKKSLAAAGAVNAEIWNSLADLGLFALPFPEEAGGLGFGLLEFGLAMEAVGRHLVIEPITASVVLAGGVLSRGGNPEQRARWLAPLLAGGPRLVLAHDSDEIETRARHDVHGWQLEGRKQLVVGAPGADRLIISTRDETGTLRLFVVPSDANGVNVSLVRLLDGAQAADVVLKNVVLSEEEMLDCDVEAVLEESFQDAVVASCWEAVGAMTAAYEQTIAYVKQREQFGRPLSAFQTIQHNVAEMAICCEEARAAALLAALSSQDSARRGRAISAAKVKVARCADVVAKTAVQLHGGMGVSDELPIASYFRKLLTFEISYGLAEAHIVAYTRSVIMAGHHAGSIVLPPSVQSSDTARKVI